jgi:hypothetical protein
MQVRVAVFVAVVAIGGGIGMLIHTTGCNKPSSNGVSKIQPTPAPKVDSAATKAHAAKVNKQVHDFCGDCHVVPPPADFPREKWKKEVQQGFDLYFASARSDLKIPLFTDILAYYEARAPESLEIPPSSTGVDFAGLQFERTDAPAQDTAPAVAHLKWIHGGDHPARLLMCDMRSGVVADVTPQRDQIQVQSLAKLKNPDHVEAADLDGDGQQEFVVCDLGSFPPGDHSDGRVVWLRPDGRDYQTIALAESIARVSDARPVDVDNDQDQDLILAVFGWRQTGEIRLLVNDGLQDGTPTFTSTTIDPRHGSIQVPVLDADGDGKQDFLTVFGQDYESVELFLNRGNGAFEKQRIFAAETPTFGSSGIRPTDLDGDGDIDILYTNGDMFDDVFLRTHHAVHWLENLGDSSWRHHELAKLPGVHRALEADLDGDGDLDVVACAFVPEGLTEKLTDIRLDSLIWLEQVEGRFTRHSLEVNACQHAVLEVGDFDADGDPDLAVGNFTMDPGLALTPVTIWWNDTSAAKTTTR